MGRFRALMMLTGATLVASVLVATASRADKPAAPPPPKSSASAPKDAGAPPRSTTDPLKPGSPFLIAITSGNAKATSHDYAGAAEEYRKAVQAAPTHPLGHYLLAEALLAAGNFTEAETSLTQAETFSEVAHDIRVKVYFLQADAKERQKKFPEAKVIWQKYIDFSQAHSNVPSYPASAKARIDAIDEMLKQEATMDPIRVRIAAEKDAGPPK